MQNPSYRWCLCLSQKNSNHIQTEVTATSNMLLHHNLAAKEYHASLIFPGSEPLSY